MAIKNKNDRAAQGLTEADERMAEEAMEKMVKPSEYSVDDPYGAETITTTYKTPAIIRVPDELSNFSPITDKLFGTEQIIIYNSHEFCYYGPVAHHLGKRVMHDAVENGKAYYGGTEKSGFFRTSYDAIDIKDTLKEVFPYFFEGGCDEEIESNLINTLITENCPQELHDIFIGSSAEPVEKVSHVNKGPKL